MDSADFIAMEFVAARTLDQLIPRQAGADWRRIWFNDQPSNLTPARVSGAVAPGAD